MTTIMDIVCSNCNTKVWTNLGDLDSADLSKTDPDGFKCCNCGHEFVTPGLDLDDLGFESLEEFQDNADIYDTYLTPNDAI